MNKTAILIAVLLVGCRSEPPAASNYDPASLWGGRGTPFTVEGIGTTELVPAQPDAIIVFGLSVERTSDGREVDFVYGTGEGCRTARLALHLTHLRERGAWLIWPVGETTAPIPILTVPSGNALCLVHDGPMRGAIWIEE